MRNRAWWFLLPALALVAFNAFVPLMTVINYSVTDQVSGVEKTEFVGLENYRKILHPEKQEQKQQADTSGESDAMAAYLKGMQQTKKPDQSREFFRAIGRQFGFTLLILLIEIPLGLGIALCLPRRGWTMTLSLVLLGIPLLIPWNIVGMVWRVLTREGVGLLDPVFAWLGYAYAPSTSTADAWWTTVAMDVWHWTPLVVFLCFAGLQTIPRPYFRAAEIDGASRWAVFRHVILPKLRYVLILAVLLRAMDSFNIFTEPYILVGNRIEFLSYFVDNLRDIPKLCAAVSIVYLFVVLVMCYALYVAMQQISAGQETA